MRQVKAKVGDSDRSIFSHKAPAVHCLHNHLPTFHTAGTILPTVHWTLCTHWMAVSSPIKHQAGQCRVHPFDGNIFTHKAASYLWCTL